MFVSGFIEVDSHYCPNCLEHLPSLSPEAALKKNRYTLCKCLITFVCIVNCVLSFITGSLCLWNVTLLFGCHILLYTSLQSNARWIENYGEVK